MANLVFLKKFYSVIAQILVLADKLTCLIAECGVVFKETLGVVVADTFEYSREIPKREQTYWWNNLNKKEVETKRQRDYSQCKSRKKLGEHKEETTKIKMLIKRAIGKLSVRDEEKISRQPKVVYELTTKLQTKIINHLIQGSSTWVPRN